MVFLGREQRTYRIRHGYTCYLNDSVGQIVLIRTVTQGSVKPTINFHVLITRLLFRSSFQNMCRFCIRAHDDNTGALVGRGWAFSKPFTADDFVKCPRLGFFV